MAWTEDDLDPAPLAQLRALQSDDDPHLASELIDSFLSIAPRSLAELGGLLARREVQALEREAHRLRGMCGALGLKRMERLCQALEEGARRGCLDGGREQVETLAQAFEPARAALAVERAKG